jgi:hypothetical protein
MIEVITFIVVGWLVLFVGAVVIWLIQTVLE